MNIDKMLSDPLKFRRKPERKGFKKFLKIIKQNEYDPTDIWHACMKVKAIKAGLIDEDLNILKEDID